jgi:tetratricopeptide (TPR) repeat protein
VGQALEARIRKLQDLCWSSADPHGRAFVHLADAHRRAGDLLEARRVLREGLDRNPDFAPGHLVAAWVSRDQDRREEAVDSFRAALDLDPRNIAALRGLAGILVEAGEVGSALAVLEELLVEDPTDSGIPGRIQELKAQLAELGAGPGVGSEPHAPENPLLAAWEDLDEVAEELNWSSAALQVDVGELLEEQIEEERGGPEPDAFAPKAESGVETEAEVEAGEAESGEAEEPQLEGGGPVVEGEPGSWDGPDAEASAEGLPEPWVAEDGIPAPALRGGRDSLVTPTLGEIYLRQGYLEWAEEVFLSLVDRDPGNTALRERLDDIRTLRLEREKVSRTEADPPPPEQGLVRYGLASTMVLTIEGLTPGAEPSLAHCAPESEDSAEELAPDTVVSIQALAPDPVLPIQALAPDPVLPIQALAPDPVLPIQALAPDPVLPIQALAPDLIVSVDSLAPDTVVSVESPQPDPVEVEAPVRLEMAQDGKPREEGTLDVFQAWLESLE